METETMGRVLVTAKIENSGDLYLRVERTSPADQACKSIEVNDALVDTGATMLSMPKRMIQQLGLEPVRTRKAMTSAGTVTVNLWRAFA